MIRIAALLAILAASPPGATAQDRDPAQADYFRAVAAFFSLPASEVAILGDWEIRGEEIAVVLFVARRAGVSPEALVALRSSGQSWSALVERYRVTPSALHVPIRDDAPAGTLDEAYADFRSTPVSDWKEIELDDEEIIGLVNVRIISQALAVPPEAVVLRTDSVASFVQLFALLNR